MKAKRVIIVSVIIAASAVAAVLFWQRSADRTAPSDAAIATEGREAPEIALMDADGKSWRLSAMRGSVVLVNFWASWCGPCKTEMPSLQKLYGTTKTEPGFKLVTVLFRDDPVRALEYLAKNKYDFPLLLDIDGSAAMAYGLTGVPETFIVDKKGVLRNKFIGPIDFNSHDALAYFRRMVEE